MKETPRTPSFFSLQKGGVWLVLILLSFLFYRKHIGEYPRYLHAWAQSDHYAIARGFLDNGFDFFHPQSFCLNPIFPAPQPLAEAEGVTAVDFPLHDFIAGFLMKMAGTEEPWLMRFYFLLLSLAGLYFLSRLVSDFVPWVWAPAAVAAFAFTSPVLTYYQAGFMPTIPALAGVFAGMYFLNRWSKTGKGFGIAWLFFLQSALIRIPFIVFLAAVAGVWLLDKLKNKKLPWKETALVAGGFVLFGAYFLWNAHLRKTYGSIFLSRFMMPESLAGLKDSLSSIWHNWGGHYLTRYHYLVVFLALALVGFKFRSLLKEHRHISQFFILALMGVSAMTLLMLRQHIEHDYYFLDTFFPVLMLAVSLALSRLPLKAAFNYSTLGIFAIVLPLATMKNLEVQELRRQPLPGDRGEVMQENLAGINDYLESDLQINKNARIVVFDACAPNLPFVYLDRKGYAVISTHTEEIENSLHSPFDLALVPDDLLLGDILSAYPSLTNELDYAGNYKGFSIFRKRKESGEQSIAAMLGFYQNLNWKSSSLQNQEAGWQWQTGATMNSLQREEAKVLTGADEFPVTARFQVNPGNHFQSQWVLFTLTTDTVFSSGEKATHKWVLEVNHQDKKIHYQAGKFEFGDDGKVEIPVFIPRGLPDGTEIKIYFWNEEKREVRLSNARMKFR